MNLILSLKWFSRIISYMAETLLEAASETTALSSSNLESSLEILGKVVKYTSQVLDLENPSTLETISSFASTFCSIPVP